MVLSFKSCFYFNRKVVMVISALIFLEKVKKRRKKWVAECVTFIVVE